MKNKKLLAILATACLMFSALPLLAQVPPPPVAGAPIDGGVSVLLVGAAIMGYKKRKAVEKEKMANKEN